MVFSLNKWGWRGKDIDWFRMYVRELEFIGIGCGVGKSINIF